MTIMCNVTGSERKRLAQALGAITFSEPVYTGAPSFAYQVGDYTVDKAGTIICADEISSEAIALVVEKLKEQGFATELEADIFAMSETAADAGLFAGDETAASDEETPAEIPAETPDVAPVAEPAGMPEGEATEADVGAETPDEAAPTEDYQPADEADAQPDEDQDEAESTEDSESGEETVADVDDTKLTISIPRAKLADDALARLRMIVSNKEELFKRVLLADALPIEVAEDMVSFPWFTLTGIDGEAEAYTQFITALCQMATEQKRVLDKPYDGDNDRFAMRIFMVRLNMKGAEFALARKLMMKNLTGNSGWRYEDSAPKPDRGSPNRSTIQHLKKAYPTGSRVELIPMNDVSEADIQIGAHGTVIGVDDNGNLFIRLDNGSTFGIAYSTESEEESESPIPQEEADTPNEDNDSEED